MSEASSLGGSSGGDVGESDTSSVLGSGSSDDGPSHKHKRHLSGTSTYTVKITSHTSGPDVVEGPTKKPDRLTSLLCSLQEARGAVLSSRRTSAASNTEGWGSSRPDGGGRRPSMHPSSPQAGRGQAAGTAAPEGSQPHRDSLMLKRQKGLFLKVAIQRHTGDVEVGDELSEGAESDGATLPELWAQVEQEWVTRDPQREAGSAWAGPRGDLGWASVHFEALGNSILAYARNARRRSASPLTNEGEAGTRSPDVQPGLEGGMAEEEGRGRSGATRAVTFASRPAGGREASNRMFAKHVFNDFLSNSRSGMKAESKANAESVRMGMKQSEDRAIMIFDKLMKRRGERAWKEQLRDKASKKLREARRVGIMARIEEDEKDLQAAVGVWHYSCMSLVHADISEARLVGPDAVEAAARTPRSRLKRRGLTRVLQQPPPVLQQASGPPLGAAQRQTSRLELPRLGFRQRRHGQVLSDSYHNGVKTLRRRTREYAWQLGLDDADWERRTQGLSEADLQGLAVLKMAYVVQLSARLIQFHWRVFARRLQADAFKREREQFAVLIQDWWRHVSAYLLPMARLIHVRLRRVRAATTISRIIRGCLERRRLLSARQLHTVHAQMGAILSQWGGRDMIAAALRIQALTRGHLTRRKMSREPGFSRPLLHQPPPPGDEGLAASGQHRSSNPRLVMVPHALTKHKSSLSSFQSQKSADYFGSPAVSSRPGSPQRLVAALLGTAPLVAVPAEPSAHTHRTRVNRGHKMSSRAVSSRASTGTASTGPTSSLQSRAAASPSLLLWERRPLSTCGWSTASPERTALAVTLGARFLCGTTVDPLASTWAPGAAVLPGRPATCPEPLSLHPRPPGRPAKQGRRRPGASRGSSLLQPLTDAYVAAGY